MENGVLKAAKAWAKANVIVSKIRQQRPYTVVDVYLNAEFDGRNHTYSNWTVAKVTWPDQWDEAEGVNIARAKAAALCAKEMVRDGWRPEHTEKVI